MNKRARALPASVQIPFPSGVSEASGDMGETWDGALRALGPAGILGVEAKPFILLVWKLRPRGERELTQDYIGVSLRVSPGDSGLQASNPVFVFIAPL